MATEKERKPHANIRGKEYFAQAIEEAIQRDNPNQTPIQRLRSFVQWAQSQDLCKSEYDFERKCSLSAKYISNNSSSGKGNIGTEMLGRIIRVFPQLNLAWLCTGDGAMLTSGGENNALSADYKQAYELAMQQINILNNIIKKQQ